MFALEMFVQESCLCPCPQIFNVGPGEKKKFTAHKTRHYITPERIPLEIWLFSDKFAVGCPTDGPCRGITFVATVQIFLFFCLFCFVENITFRKPRSLSIFDVIRFRLMANFPKPRAPLARKKKQGSRSLPAADPSRIITLKRIGCTDKSRQDLHSATPFILKGRCVMYFRDADHVPEIL